MNGVVGYHHPFGVVERAADNFELRADRGFESLNVGGDGGDDGLDPCSQVLNGKSLGFAGSWIEPDVGYVGLIAFADDCLFAAVEVEAHERRFVTADGAQQ